MTDELLAYLLDDLSAERRWEIERRVAADPAWARELERLQRCLAAGSDPAECAEEPPADLLARTCGLVERADHAGVCSGERPLTPTAAAAAMTAEPITAGAGPRWSLADCTVCAGMFMALAMLTLPAMRESRDAARRQVCQAKLGALGVMLFNYQQNHRNRLPVVRPGDPAGIFAVKLADFGGVSREELAQALVCPDSEEAMRRFAGSSVPIIPTLAQLRAARGTKRLLLVRTMGGSVAFRIGYYDNKGGYRFPAFTGGSGQPMAADAPNLSRSGVYMVNHGGCGQNVLDQSLAVRFRTKFVMPGGDNIYLNFSGKPAAGRAPTDVVLSRSDRRPDGLALVPVGTPN